VIRPEALTEASSTVLPTIHPGDSHARRIARLIVGKGVFGPGSAQSIRLTKKSLLRRFAAPYDERGGES
jgi:hypothetical protein